jgi:hypothetical protein
VPRIPISEVVGHLAEIMRGFKTTPVAEAAAKTSEELAAEVPAITEHLPDVVYNGPPKLKPYVRATAPSEKPTLKERVQGVKTGIGGIFSAEPNLPKNYQNMFLSARYEAATAQERADAAIHSRITSKLEGDVATKSRLMMDYLTLADEFSDLHSKWTKDPDTPVFGRGGATLPEIEDALHIAYDAMAKHPDAVQASQGFRAVSDELFNNMVQYGLITPNRYRKDWTPRQQIMEMARGLSAAYGDQSVGGEVLAQMERRTLTGGVTETNLLKVLRSVLKDYHEKVAGDKLVMRILSDPAVNRTADFKVGDRLPRGWVNYRPRPGLPGWRIPDADAQVAAGVADALGADVRTLTPGGFVIPEDISRRLEKFYPERPGQGGETAYKVGRFLARAFTVYNPANTALNLGSDFGIALLGLPGERSQTGAFLRFYPRAFVESMKGAFGGESPVFERAVQEGLGSATYVESVTGEQIPEKLAEALGEQPSKNPFKHLANVMRRARLGVEMAPRIAAGQAAEHVTGNPEEFGRVGRAITLPYGAGAPAVTRTNIARWVAPFWQFMGLATERTAKLLTEPGSRGRAWAAVLGVPVAAFMWNRHNEDFRQVEMALRKRDRYAMHIIAPDPADPSKPALDRNGKPIVLRFRYFMPEEVAQQFGVSMLPSRITDLVEGRVGPGEAIGESAASAVEQGFQQFVPAGIAVGIGTGRNVLTGQEQPRAEIARKSIPILREVEEAVRGVQNAGPIEGVKRLAEEVSGVRFATPVRRGRSDADLEDLKVQLKDTKTQMRSAYRRGDRARGEEFRARVYKIANRIRAINKARRKARKRKV